MLDYSLLTSITINLIAFSIIIGIDYINIENNNIEKYHRNIGYLLFAFFCISLFVLTYEIIYNIILLNTKKEFNVFVIISIFASNILTFTLGYYSLYLINGNNFYIKEKEFNGYETNAKIEHINKFNLYSYMNCMYFTFFINFATSIREMDYRSIFSKFLGVLQLLYSVTIGIFFFDKIVDSDFRKIKKPIK